MCLEQDLLRFALGGVDGGLALAFAVVDELAALGFGAIDCSGALSFAGDHLLVLHKQARAMGGQAEQLKAPGRVAASRPNSASAWSFGSPG